MKRWSHSKKHFTENLPQSSHDDMLNEVALICRFPQFKSVYFAKLNKIEFFPVNYRYCNLNFSLGNICKCRVFFVLFLISLTHFSISFTLESLIWRCIRKMTSVNSNFYFTFTPQISLDDLISSHLNMLIQLKLRSQATSLETHPFLKYFFSSIHWSSICPSLLFCVHNENRNFKCLSKAQKPTLCSTSHVNAFNLEFCLNMRKSAF